MLALPLEPDSSLSQPTNDELLETAKILAGRLRAVPPQPTPDELTEIAHALAVRSQAGPAQPTADELLAIAERFRA
jgi:hypothetical protein